MHFLIFTSYWLTNLQINWKYHSLLRTNSSSASQEISRTLCCWMVYYLFHTRVNYFSQINPIHVILIFPEDLFNIILPSTPGSSKCSLYLRFPPPPNPVCVCPATHTCYVPLLSHSSLFDYPGSIWWGVQVTEQLITQSFPLPVTLSLLCPNTFLSTLFSNVPRLCSLSA